MTITKQAVMERAMEYGVATVTSKEMVSIISNVSVTKLDELIETHGDLHGALKNAKHVRGGITKRQEVVLNMLSEFHKREIKEAPGKVSISGPEVVFDLYRREMESYDCEHLFLLALNTKNQVIKKVLLSRGVKDGTIFHTGEAFKQAAILNAASVMLMHNHPSGDPTPSNDDINVTRRMAEAGKLLGIRMLDHIVFGRNKFSSISREMNDN